MGNAGQSEREQLELGHMGWCALGIRRNFFTEKAVRLCPGMWWNHDPNIQHPCVGNMWMWHLGTLGHLGLALTPAVPGQQMDSDLSQP